MWRWALAGEGQLASFIFLTKKNKKSAHWHLPEDAWYVVPPQFAFPSQEKASCSPCDPSTFGFRWAAKKEKKKRPLAITAKGRYQRGSTFVYQCFTATELRKSSINDCCCNGQTRSFLLFFRKNDSKMCFTTMRYLFAPTRDSLQTASLATLLFDVCFIKLCLTLLALKENVKHFFWNFRNFVKCTGFEGKIQGKEDATA